MSWRLFDDIAAVTTIPLERRWTRFAKARCSEVNRCRHRWNDANWGEPCPAVCEWRGCWNHELRNITLGTSLKSRVVIHNSGNEPVIFVTRSFHQPEHKVKSLDGASPDVESTYWTTLGRPEPYRLHPGEYCEVHAPGIGIGPRNSDDEDWANIRPGSWILASEGEKLYSSRVKCCSPATTTVQVNPNWWLEFITERI